MALARGAGGREASWIVKKISCEKVTAAFVFKPANDVRVCVCNYACLSQAMGRGRFSDEIHFI